MKKRLNLLILLVFCIGNSTIAQTNTKPNILFMIADDAGTDFSAYGCQWVKTPGFDRIAKEGVLFNNAFTPNAKCAPSRSCILTGRNPWQLDEAMNHNIYFPNHFMSFMECLAKHQYYTGHTGKGYGPGKALDPTGKDRLITGKEYASKLMASVPTTHIGKTDYVGNFQDFLANNNAAMPWAFWVGFAEPHRFYEYGSSIRAGKKTSQVTRVPTYWPDTDTTRTDLLDYGLEIEYMDSQIVRMLDVLEKNGILDNTIVIFTSDHGMPFPRVKGNQYYHSNRIPLAIRYGKNVKNPGRVIEDHVNFTDLAPTFLDLAGIKAGESGMMPFIGSSLMPLLKSGKNGVTDTKRNFTLVGQERHDIGRPLDQGYPIRGLNKNGFLLLKNYETSRWPVCNPETGYLNTDGGATKSYLLDQRRKGYNKYFWSLCFGKRPMYELYDIRKDQDCVNNLADKPAFKTVLATMEKEMEAKLLAQGDLRMLGYGTVYEKYPLVTNNGFYESYFKGVKGITGWVTPSDYELNSLD
jgi:N-sulfoglucosamine sulfohydrolase